MAPKIQWPLVLFSMLAGCGGCAFAFAGIANAMGESISVTLFVTIVAFVLVVVGAICSMMHLATPKHAFAAVTHLLSFSGISVELIMLGVVCALMALFAGSIVFIGNATATLVLGMLGALSGVVLAFVTGHGYLISSKPTWNTKKLPLAYTGTAASCTSPSPALPGLTRPSSARSAGFCWGAWPSRPSSLWRGFAIWEPTACARTSLCAVGASWFAALLFPSLLPWPWRSCPSMRSSGLLRASVSSQRLRVASPCAFSCGSWVLGSSFSSRKLRPIGRPF